MLLNRKFASDIHFFEPLSFFLLALNLFNTIVTYWKMKNYSFLKVDFDVEVFATSCTAPGSIRTIEIYPGSLSNERMTLTIQTNCECECALDEATWVRGIFFLFIAKHFFFCFMRVLRYSDVY